MATRITPTARAELLTGIIPATYTERRRCYCCNLDQPHPPGWPYAEVCPWCVVSLSEGRELPQPGSLAKKPTGATSGRLSMEQQRHHWIAARLAGLDLLKGDLVFIAERFVALDVSNQHDALDLLTDYRRHWQQTAQAEAEPDEHRRDSAGRRAANLWLLRLSR